MAQARLQIEVISASNLYNSDGFLAGKSDPYVVVEVPGQPSMKFQTPIINNCLDPVWNHVGEIEGFMDGDVLEFQVWDSDTWPKQDQLLGKAALSAADFYPDGLEGPLVLSESQTEAQLVVRVVVLDTVDPGQDPNMMAQGQEGVEYQQVEYQQDPNMMVQGQEGVEYQQDTNMMVQGQEGVEGQQVEYQQGVAEGGVVMEGGVAAAQAGGPQTLHVNVMNARGLYNADGFLAGKSDPYCICLIPEKKHSKFQTKTINNCLDPDWNHTGLIHGFEAGDSLEFQVWDSDTFPKPDQLLGKVTLTPQDFANNPDGIQAVLQLSGGLSQESGSLEVRIVADVGATLEDAEQAAAHEAAHGSAAAHADVSAHPGAKRLSADSQHLEKLQGAKMVKLKVTVFGAAGLYNADGFLAGKSDPYVVCQVPEKKAQKFKTKVLSNTLEPTWNHLSIIGSFVVGHTLELAVYDSDTPPKPDQLLGKVVLASEDFFPYGLEGSLILAESKAQGATLSVRIEVLPDLEATGLTGAKPAATTHLAGQVRPATYQYQPGAVYYQPQQTYLTTGSVQYVTGSPTYTYAAAAAPTTVVSQAVAQTAFNAIDANHDGVITRAEFDRAAAATEPVATKVEYSAAPVTYTQAATYTAPTTTYTQASSPVTYTQAATYAAPTTTYTQAATYAAPTTTYTSAPATYVQPASAIAPAPTTVTLPATAAAAVTPSEPVAAAAAVAAPATASVQAATYAAPTTTYVAPATYVQPASAAAPAPTTVTLPATAAAAVAPAEPVAAAAAVAAPATASLQATYSTAVRPGTYTMSTQAAYSMATQAAPFTVTSMASPAGTARMTAAPMAATSTRFQTAPLYSVASGSTAARVAYSPAPAQVTYTMAAPQIVTTASTPAPTQSLFDKLDKNHDGVITKGEFASAVR